MVNYTHFIFGGEIEAHEAGNTKRRIASNDLVVIEQEAYIAEYFVPNPNNPVHQKPGQNSQQVRMAVMRTQENYGCSK